MQVKLAVIADDLTGANDTGVQFAKQGLNTAVLFSETQLQPAHLGADVIVLNSDSRALTSEKAYEAVFNLAAQLNKLSVSKVFKKIDSTMRGNIGPEIDAVMDAFKLKTSFVVPAFPNSNRVTINGNHYVNGVLLEETPIAQDPVCPVTESYLPKLLQEQSNREVALISISDVRKGKSHLSEKINELSSGDISKIIIVDATTDEELKMIVEAAEFLEENFLWVGSAGIAYHLFNTGQRESPLHHQQSGQRLPVLVVAGSVNPVIDRQIQVLRDKFQVEEIVISPEEFFYKDRRKCEIERIVKAGQALLGKSDLVITTNREREAINRVKDLQKKLRLSNFDVGYTIAESMGVIAGELIESRPICGAVLTGGDIAGAACKVLNGEGIRVIGEVEAGIPYGKLFGGTYDGMPIVTKAGAFGTDQALAKALQTITDVNAHVKNCDWRHTDTSYVCS
ncbi:four-carbon acid sugar kinase family protein [Bacillus salipaludis]|uniref:Four-carbon acid sugar kinase family protein n=1 Tax=Bacillus salipaludis TaxID=2547811 RepID=A0AA90TVJ1_9BACI|nr:four-carbon acid sugar kinase family protein [Bacillus salipaludis]MDQ6596128.1 four-carbon acid sugar kinase family protein [Bacillus salipaludis]